MVDQYQLCSVTLPSVSFVQSMSDKFVTDTKDHFVVGQTVIAKVMSTDEEKQRVLLNLKVSECSSGDSAAESFALLNQYFKELKEIRNLLRRGKKIVNVLLKGIRLKRKKKTKQTSSLEEQEKKNI